MSLAPGPADAPGLQRQEARALGREHEHDVLALAPGRLPQGSVLIYIYIYIYISNMHSHINHHNK